MPSLSASAELPCRSGRRSEELRSKQLLHCQRHRRRSKRRQKAFWPVWSNRNVGRLFLPNGWNVPALHYPDRTSRNGIRKSAWHENNVSVKKLKRDVNVGKGGSIASPSPRFRISTREPASGCGERKNARQRNRFKIFW